MPYIPKKDYPSFEKGINAFIGYVVKSAGFDEAAALELFGVIVFELAKRTMPDRRYWVVAETTGVLVNAADEMERRFKESSIRQLRREIYSDIYFDIDFDSIKDDEEWNDCVNNLASAITAVASDYDLQAGGKYPGAYAGLLNYCLTCIVLRLRERLCGEDACASKRFIEKAMAILYVVKDKFYESITIPYEDEQINKVTNGDLPEYKETIRVLESLKK